MGRFGRFGVTLMQPLEEATRPVVRNEALVFPDSLPPQPATDPSAPAEFAPFTIRPEVIGSPVMKQVPAMFDRRTLTSLFPSLVASTPLRSSAMPPPEEAPVPPPGPVNDIFNMKATDKIDQAIEMDYAASLQSDIANDLQRKADEAAYVATKAHATATYDPTFDAQAAAKAAAARADDAQYLANRAAEKAALIEQQASVKADEANQATEQLVHATEQQQSNYEASVAAADSAALDEALSIPGMVPPEMLEQVEVPGFSVSPVMAAGALGVVGFLLGGTRGGALGALLGGAGAYFMRKQQVLVPVQLPPNPPSPLPSGYDPNLGWE